jgi:hypothetical protein
MTISSVVFCRPLGHRVAPRPERPSNRCSIGCWVVELNPMRHVAFSQTGYEPSRMVLTLICSGKSNVVESSEGFEFRGPELSLLHHSQPIARFQLTHWVHAGRRCSYIGFRTGVWIQFQDGGSLQGPVLGPIASVHVRDIHLFAGRQRAAKLSSRTQRWVRDDSGETWVIVRILPSRPHRS